MNRIEKLDLYKVAPRWLPLKVTSSEGIEGGGTDCGMENRHDLPGLGVEKDEEKVKEAAKEGHNWHNPIWRNEDESVTEW